jgi:hypothetical protein
LPGPDALVTLAGVAVAFSPPVAPAILRMWERFIESIDRRSSPNGS